MNKQAYSYQQQISNSSICSKFGNIVLSLSKYNDCLFVFINQTGTVGSILEGTVLDSSANFADQYQQFSEQTNSRFIYEIRPLFGSTEILFYELLLRRVMSVIWQQLKAEQKFRTILNISLPVLHASFNQQAYYSTLVQECKIGLKSVL